MAIGDPDRERRRVDAVPWVAPTPRPGASMRIAVSSVSLLLIAGAPFVTGAAIRASRT